MAQQLQKKFIANNAIDGDKIKLLKDQSLEIENQAGQVVELLKLGSADEVLVNGEEVATKGYVDQEVGAEETRALAAEGVLTAAISDEQTRAEGQEAAIRTEFAAADTTLHGIISSEIDADVLVEKQRAEGEEARIEGKVDQEVIDRAAADTALQNQINDIISNTDASALDSLSEIVSAFQSADSDLSAAITTALGTHTSELATESAARIAADSAIQADVDANEAAAAADRAAIRTEFAAADSAIQADVDANEAARIAEDALMLKLDGSRSMEADLSMASGGIEVMTESSQEVSLWSTSVSTTGSVFSTSSTAFPSNSGISPENQNFEGVYLVMPTQKAQEFANSFDNNNDGERTIDEVTHIEDPSSGAIYEVIYDAFPAYNLIVFLFKDSISYDKDLIASDLEDGFKVYSSSVVSSKITGLADGVDASDAVNKGQMDAALASAASDVTNLESSLNAEINDRINADANIVTKSGFVEAEGDLFYFSSASNYASGAETLNAADGLLDAQIKVNEDAIAQEVTDRQTADTTLQSAIDAEKARIDAILSASEANKDSFAEIVTLINSIDAENDTAFAGHVSNYNAYVSANDARVLAVEGEVDVLQGEMDTVEGRLDAVEPKVSTLESEMDAVEGRASTLESEMDSAEGRLDAIEAEAFYKEQIVVSAAMVSAQKITLAEVPEANSVVAFVGRLALHEGASQDYEMNGADLEFRGDIASGGVSALAEGDVITVSYYK